MQPVPPAVAPQSAATPSPRRVRRWAVPLVAVVDLVVAWVGGFVALALLVGTGSFGVGPWPVTVVGAVGLLAVGIVLLRTGGRFGAAVGTVCCTLAVCVGVPMIGVTAESTPASLLLAVAAVVASLGAVAARRSAGTVGLAVGAAVGASFVVLVAVSG